MKKIWGLAILTALLTGCATGGSVSSGTGSATTSSAESQARELTNRMKTELSLDNTQADKVFTINVVNQKILQRLKQNNDASVASSAKENYHKELKGVLTSSQYEKFKASFPHL